MTDALLLREQDRQELVRLLARHLPNVTAWAYGSRVNGGAHEGSDLDIVLRSPDLSPIPLEELRAFVQAVRDSNIPILVEARDWARLPESFQQEIMKNYVVLRETVSEWKDEKLGNIAEVVDSLHKTPSYSEYGYPMVRVTDVKKGILNLSDTLKVSKEVYEDFSKKHKAQIGDIIFTRVGSYGNSCIVKTEEKFCLGQNTVFILPKIHPDFLYYYLNSPDGKFEIESSVAGSTQPTISLKSIKNFNVPCPPLPEQKAIASVLSSLDDKIDLLHRQNKTLEAMAEALFRQWFVEEAGEDWPVVKVGDFVSTNSSSLTKSNSIQWIKYLDTGSLAEGKIESYQEMSIDEAPSRAKRIVKHNDILISTVRPNQKHYGILLNPYHDLIVSTGFCVISCKNICPYFLYVFLTSDDMTEYLHSIAEGSTSTYPSLKPSDIEALEFNLPPKQKIEQFSIYANSAWGKIDKNYKQIRTLEKLRDTLMPKLMSGEVRVAC